MSHPAAVLVATLGAEPQVITLTLDSLIRQDERVCRVEVMHTAPTLQPIQQSLTDLRQEFDTYPGYEHGPSLRFIEIGSPPISDVISYDDTIAVFRTLYQRMAALKSSNERLVLCPAGGRKTMSMYAMLAAQLLFDENDRLYLLFSTDKLRLERRFHASSDEASLVRVPVLPWRYHLADYLKFVTEDLTTAERDVLAQLARDGLSDRQIAQIRNVKDRTIETQIANIRDKFYDIFGTLLNSRQEVIAEFSPYFLVMSALGDLLQVDHPGNP